MPTGRKFIKPGSRVLYRWSDVLERLDRNTPLSLLSPAS
jgi:hypothetical protein